MTDCCETKNNCQGKIKKAAAFSVALVGNPNCGKTTLFNALTGGKQRIGNWPGVTVERKSGFFNYLDHAVEVVDLPGIYSLILASETSAIDERIASEFILHQEAQVVVNIVDASNLERHLYLTFQLLEMQTPVILAVNMMDVAKNRQIHLNLSVLAKQLGCPVVALEANKGGGISELKRVIATYVSKSHSQKKPSYPLPIQQAIQRLATPLKTNDIFSKTEKIAPEWVAVRLLEEDCFVRNFVSSAIDETLIKEKQQIQQTLGEDVDILLAESRYQQIQQLLTSVQSRSALVKKTWTERLDSIVLNRFLGIPIFLSVMYLLFVFAINVGGAFQDFFDISSQTIFVDGLAYLLTNLGAPTWVTVLLAEGVGKGINTTITFIPVIGAMFLFLALLEDSGYMARAAFVIDRFMRMLGLPGKAFVPMIVGFGCNVPAVMGARTLENKRDRILTIMMTPFMSCGARLAIFAVFTAAFFPRGGQNVVFALYLIGIGIAILTGFLLRQTVLKGDPSPLVMELPLYHLPRTKTVFLHAWQRLKGFVFRAGKLIVPICVLIGALNSLNLDGSINTAAGDTHSLLSAIGRWTTPLFSPMGIHANNWPATVGLVTGVLAKEVVVGTLNSLYSQVGHFASASVDSFQFWGSLANAWHSIPQNLSALGGAFANPVLAQAPIDNVNQGVYGLMYQRFDGKAGAFAYLLFVLLYFPCVSTMAAMLRELHRGWAIFSAAWMTCVAYGAAVIFYQAATWHRHPLSSLTWILTLSILFLSMIGSMRVYAILAEKKIGRQSKSPLAGEMA